MKQVRLILTLALSLWLNLAAHAQVQLQPSSPPGASPTDANSTRYYYLFVNERFTIPRIEIEFDGSGVGQYTFVRKGNDEIANKLKLSTSLLGQLRDLFTELNFLASTEDYQYKKDFSHLGTMTISLAQGGRSREAKFNYTDNQVMSRLAELFRNIATQEMRVFELQNTRESDPISTPAQMRLLESELRGKHLADPPQLIPLLKDIQQDEGVPLIARNHAERLIQMIQKAK